MSTTASTTRRRLQNRLLDLHVRFAELKELRCRVVASVRGRYGLRATARSLCESAEKLHSADKGALLEQLRKRSRGCLGGICSEARKMTRWALRRDEVPWTEATECAAEADRRLQAGLANGAEATDWMLAGADRADEALRDTVQRAFDAAEDEARRGVAEAKERLLAARLAEAYDAIRVR
jgi:hypothetical protein